ncbi:hypothetical protein LOK49_LG12G03062 [Camellia lanceoleosa]|uniref:Uncharacterized protein n=1 Tax=Camellia lanceoleosa TaxID=1840588 RepID=A0ACC0FUH6_9ERIC|nr:hypothetical protein LOK49_LG12G03062 [Camellia lanceoleosa]
MLLTITDVQESKAKDDHFCLLENNVTGLVGACDRPELVLYCTTATFATAMCNIVPAMFFLMAWILS